MHVPKECGEISQIPNFEATDVLLQDYRTVWYVEKFKQFVCWTANHFSLKVLLIF